MIKGRLSDRVCAPQRASCPQTGAGRTLRVWPLSRRSVRRWGGSPSSQRANSPCFRQVAAFTSPQDQPGWCGGSDGGGSGGVPSEL